VEKKLDVEVTTRCQAKDTKGRAAHLMFQDEARFGRMIRIRRCWAPAPMRPVVQNGYQREYTYLYGAVDVATGEFEQMICDKMNSSRMSEFLARVSAAYKDRFIVMVEDGVSSHRGKDVVAPENIRLLPLPPHSPEINPCENIWGRLRERHFPNRVYNSMKEVVKRLEIGVPAFAESREILRKIAGRKWAIMAILNGN
jgi:transposase